MKPREPRLNVMIKARVRAGASWNDAMILNMSSKGLLVRSERPPSRGSFLEIRRGHHVIVARVIWSGADRFGVQSQDPVPAAQLIRDPDAAPVRSKPAGGAVPERRAAARPTEVRHESSRHKSRAAQFSAIALTCGLAALLIATAVAEVVARPLGAAGQALAAN